MSWYEGAEPGWLTIEVNPNTGKTSVEKVWHFEMNEEGITPLVKNADGAMVESTPNLVDVIRATPLEAAKIAAMYKLKAMADRATTQQQMDSISEASKFVMAWSASDR
ncbi:hypothetical protein HY68_02285 [Streptomyces sp. AcH 505]|uniref:hypothetical protein n=1 Tax=Streptomyces sp. AcH 505 TaxID=352211 RepID=UPI00059240E0|nr:hypothetical protein HY68_02285 [Streptomyces sp. AcH 505]